LRPSRKWAAGVHGRIVVEGPLVNDVLEDLAHSNVPLHRDVEARPKVVQGLPHRREEAWRLSKGRADVLADVPDADGHDVPGVGLPPDDRRGLTPFPPEGFPHRESGGVVTPADARVRRPSF